jgi:hypothetical protein
MIRRRIPNRPKRFSRPFILSQLRKRNQYRSNVRQIQRNPDQPNVLGYDVPAPIRVGATVTAYNKRFRILHRGVVLFHDVRGHGYLIQFERKELGHEFCPDTEVAQHGMPEILVRGTNTPLKGSSFGYVGNNLLDAGILAYGTSIGPSIGTSMQFLSFITSCLAIQCS